jgi:hypothetical protein
MKKGSPLRCERPKCCGGTSPFQGESAGSIPAGRPSPPLLVDHLHECSTLAGTVGRRSAFAWCHEFDKQCDPGAPRHHRLSPPDSSGEHAPQILARKGHRAGRCIMGRRCLIWK